MPENSAKHGFLSLQYLRLTTIVRVRWLAIVCQTSTVLFVALYLGFPFPLPRCLMLIALSTWVNLFLTFSSPPNHRITPLSSTIIFSIDVFLLSGLFYYTGGLLNPFSVILIGPAGLAASILGFSSVIFLDLQVIASASVLAFFHYPLPWYAGTVFVSEPLMIVSMWAAIIATLIFITTYSYRVAGEARQLANALTETEFVLQQEQYISALDGMAAAAAHELGTPLATIQIVARELHNQLGSESRFHEDTELLISQTQRCRDILQTLTRLPLEANENLTTLNLPALIETSIEPYRNSGVEITVKCDEENGSVPMFHRNQNVLYGLGNLVENAVDFARSKVFINYRWTKKQISIRILDDGKGFSSGVIEKIGEPYITSREQHRGGGGLGLGLFIAKTLLERSGAHVYFRNNPDDELGAEVQIIWPRSREGLEVAQGTYESMFSLICDNGG